MTYNQEILKGLSEEEKQEVFKILNELSKEGKSETYNKLLYEDYDEIPVDVETFLKDPNYLGKGLVNEEGKFTVFPYWVETLKKIFPTNIDTAYNTLALSGAIGLGKSFVAVLCGLYELYRMLCLKDPYLHYGLQPIDKITFAFMNITLDASKGVAWDKCQQLLQTSPWFMSKGTLSGSTNVVWNPPKGIELIAGSLSRHIIGRAVFWCLDGDTIISTTNGDYKIKDLVDKKIKVYNISEDGKIIESEPCTVKPTATEIEEYEIELEDSTIIKCTPTHRFMLKDGSYKEAQYLTDKDDILEFKPFGYIYKITNKLNGKFYIGKRISSTFDSKYWGSGKYLKAAIKKYGLEYFNREILCWAKSKEELCALEKQYIRDTEAIKEGYNIALGGDGGSTVSGTIKITNGFEERHIALGEKIPEGWIPGSKQKGISKASKNYRLSWTKERRQKKSILSMGELNSQYGRGDLHTGKRNGRYAKPCPEHVKDAARKSNSKWIYTYKGKDFLGISKLIYELNSQGFNIKATGIERAIEHLNKTYPELNGCIIKRRIQDEN